MSPEDPSPDSRSAARHLVRYELVVIAVFSVVWLVAVLALFGILPLAGLVPLDLYRFYSVAGILGWLTGNIYVLRRRALAGHGFGKRMLLAYLVGPPGLLYLLRAMAPAMTQNAAPFVPVYAFAVYAIFFLVPVTLKTR